MARDGRRRRVLNDEARSAHLTTHSASGATDDADSPRYGELAGIEHHPQITDYIPRRKRAVLITLTAGLAMAAAAQSLTHFAVPIADAVAGLSAADVSERLAGGMTAWASALALLLSAALARIIFSLRRHRVGDVRGRYRVWRWVGVGAVALSIDSVVGAHELLAATARSATGWSLTATGVEWWLAPTVLVGGWIVVLLLLEVGESRPASAILVLATTCYGLAGAGALGWSPATLGNWADALTRVVPLVGHTLGLVALTVFARYVVLDVQGLIGHVPRRTAKKPRRTPAVEAAEPGEFASTAAARPRPSIAARITPALDDDAAEDEPWAEDDQNSQNVRPLSKAERKRLRKQGRAA